MIEWKQRYLYLVLAAIMLFAFIDSELQIFAQPVSLEMQLIAGLSSVICLMCYSINLHAEQTREAIKAIHEELEA